MHGLRRFLQRLFNWTLAPILALILLFEEWGWEPLARLLGVLARLPLWARMEAFISRLPPYGALVVFCVPALLLLPVKLLALYWIGRGHTLLGLAVVLGAKLMGTAAVARLFALTQPALMRLAWFAHAYGRWKRWKDQLLTRFRATPAWHSVTVLAQRARLRASAVVRGLRDWLRP